MAEPLVYLGSNLRLLSRTYNGFWIVSEDNCFLMLYLVATLSIYGLNEIIDLDRQDIIIYYLAMVLFEIKL